MTVSILGLASLKICLFYVFLSCSLLFFISSLSYVFFCCSYWISNSSWYLLPCLGLLSSHRWMCLFPQSARSAGLRVIPTAWHFRLWVCLPLLIPSSIIPSSSPYIYMSWQTLMWTNSNQLTKRLGKHSSISCNVVLFRLRVFLLMRQITLY